MSKAKLNNPVRKEAARILSADFRNDGQDQGKYDKQHTRQVKGKSNLPDESKRTGKLPQATPHRELDKKK